MHMFYVTFCVITVYYMNNFIIEAYIWYVRTLIVKEKLAKMQENSGTNIRMNECIIFKACERINVCLRIVGFEYMSSRARLMCNNYFVGFNV